VKEKILNSFLSTSLDKLGLIHINSEVPKVLAPKKGKRTDILAYDKESKRPMIIELKTKKDPDVISQLNEYISYIPQKYPHLFEELNAFRKDDKMKFNYDRGIIGLVISPEPPPVNINDNKHTLLWAQYKFENNKFDITNLKKFVSESSESASFFNSRTDLDIIQPTDFIKTNLKHLRVYVEELHNLYLSISSTVYPRYKIEYNYIAYWPTNGTSAIYGFNTGPSRSYLDVEFHIDPNNHSAFRKHNSVNDLKSVGLDYGRPRKDVIFPIRITEEYAENKDLVENSLGLFKSISGLSYKFRVINELQNYSISDDSVNKLSLSNFGL
jgi:hypothetical protein